MPAAITKHALNGGDGLKLRHNTDGSRRPYVAHYPHALDVLGTKDLDLRRPLQKLLRLGYACARETRRDKRRHSHVGAEGDDSSGPQKLHLGPHSHSHDLAFTSQATAVR